MFKEDKTQYSFRYCHQARDDLVNMFKKFMADSQALKMYSRISVILRVWSDNGGKYTSSEFKQFLLDNGIQHETLNPYKQFGNGGA